MPAGDALSSSLTIPMTRRSRRARCGCGLSCSWSDRSARSLVVYWSAEVTETNRGPAGSSRPGSLVVDWMFAGSAFLPAETPRLVLDSPPGRKARRMLNRRDLFRLGRLGAGELVRPGPRGSGRQVFAGPARQDLERRRVSLDNPPGPSQGGRAPVVRDYRRATGRLGSNTPRSLSGRSGWSASPMGRRSRSWRSRPSART